MLIPISDDDKQLVKPAYVTWMLIAINVAVFMLQLNDPSLTLQYGAVAAEITSGQDIEETVVIPINAQEGVEIPHQRGPRPIYLTLITSIFLHGGWGHLFGNMLYLWIFGDNVEHRFGHFKFLIFYLLSGVVAALAQIAVSPDSIMPMIGASGAISGVVGAYLVLFPRNRVYVLFFIRIISVPAVVVIVLWAGLQFFSGYQSLGGNQMGGVAYMAHIGGFVAGVATAVVARLQLNNFEPDTPLRRAYERDPNVYRIW
jgi:membrane associated rhomboid family serine protease